MSISVWYLFLSFALPGVCQLESDLKSKYFGLCAAWINTIGTTVKVVSFRLFVQDMMEMNLPA